MATKLKPPRWESAELNNRTFLQYRDRISEIAMSSFEWINLPDSVDARFMEMILFLEGFVVFFKEDTTGKFLALQCAIDGKMGLYNIPNQRRAYSTAIGYSSIELDNTNSVLIFNNMMHKPSMNDAELYARKLSEIDRTIDVNVRAQKTPIIIKSTEDQRFTLKQAFMQFTGNEPLIVVDKKFDMGSFDALKIDAPFISPEMQMLKNEIWNECLTNFGVSNYNTTKKERLITSEVGISQGGVNAIKFSRLHERKYACQQINKMFGLNMDVKYREDTYLMDKMEEEVEIENKEGGESYE